MWILGDGKSVRAFRPLEEMAAEWFSTERWPYRGFSCCDESGVVIRSSQ